MKTPRLGTVDKPKGATGENAEQSLKGFRRKTKFSRVTSRYLHNSYLWRVGRSLHGVWGSRFFREIVLLVPGFNSRKLPNRPLHPRPHIGAIIPPQSRFYPSSGLSCAMARGEPNLKEADTLSPPTSSRICWRFNKSSCVLKLLNFRSSFALRE